MPFETQSYLDAGVRAPGLIQPPDAPEGSLWAAATRQENTIAAVYNYMADRTGFIYDPDHNPIDLIKDTKYEASYLHRFVDSRSAGETQARMRRIDQEEDDRRLLDAGGFAGFVAQATMGLADPTILLPMGIIYRGVRMGSPILKSAASGAGFVGAQAALQESILYGTHETRAGAESTMHIATGAIVGALLGSAASYLTSKQLANLTDNFTAFRNEVNAEIASGGAGAVGAASARREFLTLASAMGGEKAAAFLSPVTRLQTSSLERAKAFIRDAADAGLSYRENYEGIVTSAGGTVETRIKMRRGPLIDAVASQDDAYSRYFFGKADVSAFERRSAAMRSEWASVTGQLGGKLTAREFREEVGRAMRRNDEHPIPEIAEAAKAFREKVFEPLKKEAIKLGLLPEDVKVLGADSYLTRVYNREMIKARRDQFHGILLRHFTELRDTASKKFEEKKAKTVAALELEHADLTTPAAARPALVQKLEADLDQHLAGNPSFVALDQTLKDLRARAGKAGATTEEKAASRAEEEAVRKTAGPEYAQYVATRNQLAARAVRLQRTEPASDAAGASDARPKVLEALGVLHRHLIDNPQFAALDGARKDLRARARKAATTEGERAVLRAEEKAARLGAGPEYEQYLATRVQLETRIARLKRTEPAGGAEPGAAGFTTARGSTYEIKADGTTVRNKAARSDPGHEGQSGPQPPSERTFYVDPADAQRLALPQAETRIIDHGDGTLSVAVQNADGRWGISPESRNIRVTTTPEVGRMPVELWRGEKIYGLDGYKRIHLGNQITELRGASASPRAAGARPEAMSALKAAHKSELGELEKRLDEVMDTHAHARDKELEQAKSIAAQQSAGASRREKTVITGRLREAEARIALAHADIVAKESKPFVRLIRDLKKKQVRELKDAREQLTAAERSTDKAADLAERIGRTRATRSKNELVESTDADMPGIVADVINTILGESVFRLPGIAVIQGPKGPLRKRILNIPDAAIEEFLESDVEKVARAYSQSMASDIELAAKFGDVRLESVLKDLTDEFNTKVGRIPAGKPGDKARVRLSKDFERAQADIGAIRDRLRGNYRQPDDPEGIAYRAGKVALNLNYVARLGGMTISSLSDAGKPIFRYGMNAFRDGWIPLLRDLQGVKLAAREVRLAGTALDMVRDQRALDLADILDDFGRGNKFERATQWGADRFGMLALMSPWNGAMKSMAGIITMAQVLHAAEAVAKGTATKKQVLNLSSAIDENMARQIWAHVEKSGTKTKGGIHLPNTEEWKLADGIADTQTIEAFRAVVNREVETMIIMPGVERPLWMSHPMGRILGQFKTFAMVSTQRTTLAGLQQRDGAALMGAVSMMALGALSSWTKAQIRGEDTSTWTQGKWTVEALDNSGLLGVLMEANNIVDKLPGGPFALGRLSGKQVSRYQSRNLVGALGGPTLDAVADLATITRIASPTQKLSAADIHAIRKIMPLQNLFYLRTLIDKVEEGINNSMNIPQRRPRH